MLSLAEQLMLLALHDEKGSRLTGAMHLGLGGAILYRSWARSACWGMVAVTLFYLAVGTIFRPDLWTDPLGPLLKTLPALMLAVTAAVLLEER